MNANETARLSNIRLLQFVAKKLGVLLEEVVFLGECTTSLFITDTASPDVRYTLDVDCIIDVISSSQYYQFESNLMKQGFKKSMQDEVTCRWHYDDVILDVMPTDEKVLGFSNRWYKSAMKNSVKHSIAADLQINTVTSPYFLATKLEAFKSRGNMDFLVSHDFEDIVSIIDGRSELIDEIEQSDQDVKGYLTGTFQNIYEQHAFHDSLPGHFIQYGSLADDRITLFLARVEQIIRHLRA